MMRVQEIKLPESLHNAASDVPVSIAGLQFHSQHVNYDHLICRIYGRPTIKSMHFRPVPCNIVYEGIWISQTPSGKLFRLTS